MAPSTFFSTISSRTTYLSFSSWSRWHLGNIESYTLGLRVVHPQDPTWWRAQLVVNSLLSPQVSHSTTAPHFSVRTAKCKWPSHINYNSVHETPSGVHVLMAK